MIRQDRGILHKGRAAGFFAAVLALFSPPEGRGAEMGSSSLFSNSGGKSSGSLVNDWLQDQSSAFSAWDLGGQARLRYEIKENAGPFPDNDFISRGKENDNDVLALRTKLHLGYTPENWVSVFVEGRDARTWWDKRPQRPDDDSFDLQQAYVQLGDIKSFPLAIKIGRQEIIYGDERFVGVSDWSNTVRVFDAVRLRYEIESLWVEGFVARVVVPYNEHFNRWNDYDTFSGLYASTIQAIPWQETQVYFFSRNAGVQAPNSSAPGVPGSPGSARDTYTYGARMKSLPEELRGWDYSAEVARQFGSVSQSGVRRDLDSFMADVTAGYTWTNVFGAPRVGCGYTYASGDSNFSDGKDETFDPLFGTNHRYYGTMDLFGLRNTHNPNLNFSWKPVKDFLLRIEYLGFWQADSHDLLYPESGPGRSANGYGRNPQFSSFVGSELDVLGTYKPVSWVEFQCGYGHFFVGDYIRSSVTSVPANGKAVDANWAYVQLKFLF